MRLSILTPAYNESANLPALYERLVRALSTVGVEWEWVVVDDHSDDDTFGVLERIALRDPRVRGVRLARRSGSHVAITCALHQAGGDAAVMMAADLQDPPEVLPSMLERRQAGAKVVWAVRRQKPGDPGLFPAIYYWIMRHPVGLKAMPATGADFFLIDRDVMEAFRRCSERNVSVLALITWLGFRQDYIEYEKQPRTRGTSGWTLAQKVKLVIDSVTSFSDFPIRLAWLAGGALLALGAVVGVAGSFVAPALGPGAALVLGAVLALAGLQLVFLGAVGEYVWRALEEARGRPIYLIEATAGRPAPQRAAVE